MKYIPSSPTEIRKAVLTGLLANLETQVSDLRQPSRSNGIKIPFLPSALKADNTIHITKNITQKSLEVGNNIAQQCNKNYAMAISPDVIKLRATLKGIAAAAESKSTSKEELKAVFKSSFQEATLRIQEEPFSSIIRQDMEGAIKRPFCAKQIQKLGKELEKLFTADTTNGMFSPEERESLRQDVRTLSTENNRIKMVVEMADFLNSYKRIEATLKTKYDEALTTNHQLIDTYAQLDSVGRAMVATPCKESGRISGGFYYKNEDELTYNTAQYRNTKAFELIEESQSSTRTTSPSLSNAGTSVLEKSSSIDTFSERSLSSGSLGVASTGDINNASNHVGNAVLVQKRSFSSPAILSSLNK